MKMTNLELANIFRETIKSTNYEDTLRSVKEVTLTEEQIKDLVKFNNANQFILCERLEAATSSAEAMASFEEILNLGFEKMKEVLTDDQYKIIVNVVNKETIMSTMKKLFDNITYARKLSHLEKVALHFETEHQLKEAGIL